MERIPVKELVGDVKTQAEKMAGDTLTVRQTGEGAIRGDRARLRQTLLILLDNALKHNPSATPIRIGADKVNKHIEFTVEDKGPGIPAEHLTHIFEHFYQVKAGNEEGHNNGLGLSIAKGLVDLNKGSVRVESQLGRATLSLPEAS